MLLAKNLWKCFHAEQRVPWLTTEIKTGAMVLLSQYYSLLQMGKLSLPIFMDAFKEGDYSGDMYQLLSSLSSKLDLFKRDRRKISFIQSSSCVNFVIILLSKEVKDSSAKSEHNYYKCMSENDIETDKKLWGCLVS